MNNLSVMLNNEQDFESKDAILKNAFEAISDRNFKKDLEKELHTRYNIIKKTKTENTKFTLKKLSYAAAAALILVLVSVYFIKINLTSVDAYQMAMETKMRHPGITKGISDNSDNLHNSILAFNKEEWSSAIAGFEKESSNDMESQFFLGLSHFYNKNYSKSIEILSNPGLENSMYKSELKWFLGLSYYLNNDKSKSYEILSKIKQGEWQYDNAQKLIH